MLKKEHKVLNEFVKYPWKKHTFKEIKLCSKSKSESYVYDSLKRFVKEKVLNEEKVGNTILYSLNLGYEKSQIYSGFIAEYIAWNQKHIPYQDLNNIMSKIQTSFFISLITGSYASNKQKKTSDLDMVIICDDSFEPKKVYAELRHDCEMNIPPIHLYVFKKSEFLKMLLDKKANYGKEIAKNNLTLFGGQAYYRIIDEAIKNGFNG